MNRLNSKLTRRALLRGTAIGAAALGAMAIAGCGGDDDEKLSTATIASAIPTTPPVTPTAAAPATLSWTRVSLQSAPGARRDHSLTFNSDDGLIYLFGGRAKGLADNELWTFDPRTAAWARVAATGAPGARFAHNAFYDRTAKRLIVSLGQGNDGAFFDDVWAYGAGAWTRLDADSVSRPEIRYGSGGAHDVAGNRILISHGFTDRGRFDDTWTFDLASGAWQQVATTGAVPIKRCLTRSLWLPVSASMLMFGGQTDSNPFLGDLWTLDVAKGGWTEQTPSLLPGPRNLYGASLDGEGRRWYIVGGNTAGGPNGETWSYDIATSAWSLVAAAGEQPPARYSTDAAHAGGALYLFGGHDGKSEIDDMWTLAAS